MPALNCAECIPPSGRRRRLRAHSSSTRLSCRESKTRWRAASRRRFTSAATRTVMITTRNSCRNTKAASGICSPMNSLALHEFHSSLNARFTEVGRMEAVEHYGDPRAEHAALRDAAALLDLSFRSRLCLTGTDRQKFLNGQVTNNVKDLKVGEGCYAALVNAKGRMQSDLNIYLLEDEILLDFEPGYSAAVAQRLEKYIIADDVQVVDVAPHYGLLSVQGPKAVEVFRSLQLFEPTPDPSREGKQRMVGGSQLPSSGGAAVALAQVLTKPMNFLSIKSAPIGEAYLMNLPRA